MSKLVQWPTWEEERLDLGSIARAFGLDPATLKLNGHYISRGVDLVSHSVTWRSLLSFFSAKGLPNGKDERSALIVDGKLSKVGSKRTHDSQSALNTIHHKSEPEDNSRSRRLQYEDVELLKIKKLRGSSLGCDEGSSPLCKLNGVGFKRKQLLEEGSLLKKLKINESSSGYGKNQASTISSAPLKCSFVNTNMKRMREDEMISSASFKRIR